MNKINRILEQEYLKLKANRKYKVSKPYKAYIYSDSIEFIIKDSYLYGIIDELCAGFFIVPIAYIDPENIYSKEELKKVRKIIRTMIKLFTEYYFHDVMSFFCVEKLPDRVIGRDELLFLFKKYKNERNLKLK